jgi:hypothetical protein
LERIFLNTNKNSTKHEQGGTTKKSRNSPIRGSIYLIICATIFLGIPVIILWFIQIRTSMLPLDLLLEVQLFGITVSTIAFFSGYFRKGSRRYAGMTLLLIASICVFFWNILNAGVIDITIQNVTLHLEFQLIMYWILVIGIILGIPYILMLLNPKLVTHSEIPKIGKSDT